MHPGEVAAVMQMCEPMLCELSKDFMKRHPDISSADAQAELALYCVIGKVTTIPLENENGAVKAVLDVMSTHVKSPDLQAVSAHNLLKHARRKKVKKQRSQAS